MPATRRVMGATRWMYNLIRRRMNDEPYNLTVTDEIYAELKSATLPTPQPVAGSHIKPWICVEVVRGIWKDADRVRRFLGSDPGSVTVQYVENNLVVMLSILVEIGCDQALRDFAQKVVSNTELQFKDSSLPLSQRQIGSFIASAAQRSRFFKKQYKYLPIVISYTRDEPVVEDPHRPLPYLETGVSLGSGSFGEVSLVTIAPGYYMDENRNVYAKPFRVACKRFRSAETFEREHRNLLVLRNNRTIQSHIIRPLTSISHGLNHYILSPYAEYGDLSEFLYEGLGDNGEEKYSFIERFNEIPRVGHRDVFEPLLQQCDNLADALSWLHDGINNPRMGQRVFFAHMDLKPDNILIEPDPRSCVGKWTLSDFGISVIRNMPADTAHLAVRENYRDRTMRTNPRRPSGTYQAPEVAAFEAHHANATGVGRASDIWSFGCILAVVLAWAIGGRGEVERFSRQRRGTGMFDYFYEESVELSIHHPERYRVNRNVISWLDNIKSTPQQHPVAGCWAEKIKRILIPNPRDRLSARRVVEALQHIHGHCTGISNSDCVDLAPRASIPPEPPSDGEESINSEPETGSPDTTSTDSQTSLPLPTIESMTFDIREELYRNDRTSLAALWILKHISRPILRISVSQSLHNGKPILAVLGYNILHVLQLNIHSQRPELIRQWKIPGSHHWENSGVCIEGKYFAVWGYCPKEEQKLHITGTVDREAGDIGDLSDDIESYSSVAVSSQGMFAFIRSENIVLRPAHDSTSIELTTGENGQPDQIFTHAQFHGSGTQLYAWAYGATHESLYVWDLSTAGEAHLPSAIHYCLDRRNPLASTKIIPFDKIPGCVLAVSERQRYLPVSLEGLQGPKFDHRNYGFLEGVETVCVLGDKTLVGLTSSPHSWRGSLVQYHIPTDRNMSCVGPRRSHALRSYCSSDTVVKAFEIQDQKVAIVCGIRGKIELVRLS